MKEIIDEIIVVLSSPQSVCVNNTEGMIDFLANHLPKKGKYHWEKKFPIAIVHSQERIKEKEVQKKFLEQGILDTCGFTTSKVTRSVCNEIAISSPQYIQQVDIMVFNAYEQCDTVELTPKRPQDFWKKLASSDGMEAMVELEYFTEMDSSKIEFELREVIRKRKENSELKDVGFIWIAAVGDSTIAQGVFEHYFHNNYRQTKRSDEGNCSYWIGWSSTLRSLSMRTFYAF